MSDHLVMTLAATRPQVLVLNSRTPMLQITMGGGVPGPAGATGATGPQGPAGPGGGIAEAPTDGLTYGRKSAGWAALDTPPVVHTLATGDSGLGLRLITVTSWDEPVDGWYEGYWYHNTSNDSYALYINGALVPSEFAWAAGLVETAPYVIGSNGEDEIHIPAGQQAFLVFPAEQLAKPVRVISLGVTTISTSESVTHLDCNSTYNDGYWLAGIFNDDIWPSNPGHFTNTSRQFVTLENQQVVITPSDNPATPLLHHVTSAQPVAFRDLSLYSNSAEWGGDGRSSRATLTYAEVEHLRTTGGWYTGALPPAEGAPATAVLLDWYLQADRKLWRYLLNESDLPEWQLVTDLAAGTLSADEYNWLYGQLPGHTYMTSGAETIDKTTLDANGHPAWLDLITHVGAENSPSVRIDNSAFSQGNVLRFLETDSSTFTIDLGTIYIATIPSTHVSTEGDIPRGIFGQYLITATGHHYLYSGATGDYITLINQGSTWGLVQQSFINFMAGQLAWSKVDKTGSSIDNLDDVDITAAKTTPVDADSLLLQDSEASSVWKKLTWANVKATLKAYFDGIYTTLEAVMDMIGGTTGGDGFLKTANAHLEISYNDAGDALTLTAINSINHAPTYIEFGGTTTQQYDVTGSTFVSSVSAPVTHGIWAGTPGVPNDASAGNSLADALAAINVSRDGLYLNVQELSGAASATNPLVVQFIWTGITTFTDYRTRTYYIGSVAHNVSIQLYNWTTSAWDTYDTFSGETDYISRAREVFSPSMYIGTGGNAGKVVMQFIHTSAGINTHAIRFDYVKLTDGGGGGGSLPIASGVAFTPTGDIASTNVQTAIAELDTEKSPKGAVTGSGLTISTDKRLLGRDNSTAGAQAIEEISLGAGLSLASDALVVVGGNGLIDWASPVAINTDAQTLEFAKWYRFANLASPADYTANLPEITSNDYGKSIVVEIVNAMTKWLTLDGFSTQTITGATTRKMWANEVAVLTATADGWKRTGGALIPTKCTIRSTSAQSVEPSTNTAVPLPNFVSGSGNQDMHDTTNNRITIIRSAEYLCFAGGGFDSVASGKQSFTGVGINTTNSFNIFNQSTFAVTPWASASISAVMTAGQFVTCMQYHNDTVARSTRTTFPSILSVSEKLTW